MIAKQMHISEYWEEYPMFSLGDPRRLRSRGPFSGSRTALILQYFCKGTLRIKAIRTILSQIYHISQPLKVSSQDEL
jgi:hypothetical protein